MSSVLTQFRSDENFSFVSQDLETWSCLRPSCCLLVLGGGGGDANGGRRSPCFPGAGNKCEAASRTRALGGENVARARRASRQFISGFSETEIEIL